MLHRPRVKERNTGPTRGSFCDLAVASKMLRVSIPLAPIKEGIGEVIGLDAAEMSGRGQSEGDILKMGILI